MGSSSSASWLASLWCSARSCLFQIFRQIDMLCHMFLVLNSLFFPFYTLLAQLNIFMIQQNEDDPFPPHNPKLYVVEQKVNLMPHSFQQDLPKHLAGKRTISLYINPVWVIKTCSCGKFSKVYVSARCLGRSC